MVIIKRIRQYWKLTAVIAAALVLFACGGGGGGSNDNSDGSSSSSGGGASSSSSSSSGGASPQDTAKENITGNINNSLDALGSMASNSGAIAKLIEAFGIDASALQNRDDDDGLTEGLEQDIDDFLTALLTAGTVIMTGNDQVTVTYDTDQAIALCNTSVSGSAGAEAAECIDFFTKLSVVINSTGADSGNLTILYETFQLVVIDYAPNNVAYTWDLDPLASALEAITASTMSITEKLRYVVKSNGAVQRPDIVKGIVKLSIQDTIVQSIKLENTTDINIAGMGYGFGLAPSTWWELIYNSQDNTAQFNMDLAELNATSPIEDAVGNPYSCMIHSQRTAWSWRLTDNGDLLTGEGQLGGANSGEQAYLELTAPGSSPVREVEGHLKPTRFSVNNRGIIDHELPVEAFKRYHNNFDVFDGIFGDVAYYFFKQIPVDSEFALGRDTSNRLAFRVNSGKFDSFSTINDTLTPSTSIVANPGDCVAVDDHSTIAEKGATFSNIAFPYSLTTCNFPAR